MKADQVAGARHGVIHERAGDDLALGVEPDVLHQHLPDALGDAAVDLAVQQQRIDHGADIVDHAVADDLDDAGLLIDFELADMAAIGIVRDLRLDRVLDQARLHALGSFSGSSDALATSLMVRVWLVFGLENMPSANRMSSSSTLSIGRRSPWP